METDLALGKKVLKEKLTNAKKDLLDLTNASEELCRLVSGSSARSIEIICAKEKEYFEKLIPYCEATLANIAAIESDFEANSISHSTKQMFENLRRDIENMERRCDPEFNINHPRISIRTTCGALIISALETMLKKS